MLVAFCETLRFVEADLLSSIYKLRFSLIDVEFLKMTNVKASSKASSSTDSYPTRAETKVQKTPNATREAVDKTTTQDKKKPRKTEKHSGEAPAAAAAADIHVKQHGAEPCPECIKEVLDSQNAVSCDGCGLWFHTNCGKVSEEIYAFLCAHNDPSLQWMCRECTVIFQQSFSSVARIEEAQKD